MHQRQKFKIVYLEELRTTMNSLVARSTIPIAQLYDVILSQPHLHVTDWKSLGHEEKIL